MDKEKSPKIEIPEEFYSFSGKKLFDRCIDCDRYLLEEGTEYFIEKAVKKYPGYGVLDIIFEYAICANCAEKMRLRMSKESLQHIEQFFANQINFEDRLNIIKNNSDKPAEWTGKCIVNGKAKEELDEYQLYAHCNGRHLILQQMPYLISGEVIEKIGHLLSKKTLDELDDFVNTHFGPPPELMEALPHKRLALI